MDRGSGTAVGSAGERAAERHLVSRGWRVLARNWRGAGGELDLVACRRGVVAICEVKTRTDAAAREEPLTAAQRERIVRAATAYLAGRPELGAHDIRFDLLTVAAGAGSGRVRHLAGAFTAPARSSSSKRRRAG
jgi:putative endonuclease